MAKPKKTKKSQHVKKKLVTAKKSKAKKKSVVKKVAAKKAVKKSVKSNPKTIHKKKAVAPKPVREDRNKTNPLGFSSYVMHLRYKTYFVDYDTRKVVMEIYKIMRFLGWRISYKYIITRLFEQVKQKLKTGVLKFEKDKSKKGIPVLTLAQRIAPDLYFLTYYTKKRKSKEYKEKLAAVDAFLHNLKADNKYLKADIVDLIIASFITINKGEYDFLYGNGCLDLLDKYMAPNVLFEGYQQHQMRKMGYNAGKLNTDMTLNMFWQAKDEYMEDYFPRDKDKATMQFAILAGYEQLTKIYYVNFNKWRVSGAIDPQVFKNDYLDPIYLDSGRFELGGIIED